MGFAWRVLRSLRWLVVLLAVLEGYRRLHMRWSFDWSGKTVLVTGASSGLGRAMALQLCRRGAHVIATARRSERLAQLRSECEGGRLTTVVADVATAEGVARVASSCPKHIDVLLLNHGLGGSKRFLNVTEADLEVCVLGGVSRFCLSNDDLIRRILSSCRPITCRTFDCSMPLSVASRGEAA